MVAVFLKSGQHLMSAAMLTGQWSHRLEDSGNLWSILPKKFQTYPDILEAAGYAGVRVTCTDGTIQDITATARIDTPEELVAFRNGGILPYVARQLVKA